jgi:hypothetical protein
MFSFLPRSAVIPRYLMRPNLIGPIFFGREELQAGSLGVSEYVRPDETLNYP